MWPTAIPSPSSYVYDPSKAAFPLKWFRAGRKADPTTSLAATLSLASSRWRVALAPIRRGKNITNQKIPITLTRIGRWFNESAWAAQTLRRHSSLITHPPKTKYIVPDSDPFPTNSVLDKPSTYATRVEIGSSATFHWTHGVARCYIKIILSPKVGTRGPATPIGAGSHTDGTVAQQNIRTQGK